MPSIGRNCLRLWIGNPPLKRFASASPLFSIETAGEAYTLTVRMPGDNGNRLLVSTAGNLTLTQKGENLLRGDAEYTCTLKNGNGDIVAEQTFPAGAEASISLERGTLSDNG